MDNATIFQALALALGLGMLVGMQRERTNNALAGIRTFPLITILGVLSGVAATTFGGWVIGAATLAVVMVVAVSNLTAARSSTPIQPGITSEIAILVMFAVGVLLAMERTAVAVVVGGGVAILLQAKSLLRAFVAKLGDRDVRAIMQFALITLVILPVLPNRTMGPFDVLNPRSVWLMVVLVVGIGLGGYVLYRWLGARTGSVLAGLVGGLVSSTATTVGLSRRAATAPAAASAALLGIMLASVVVYVRILIEMYVAGGPVFPTIAPAIVVLGLSQATIAAIIWWRARGSEVTVPEQENPADLRSALVFGALYAIILVLVAAVREYLGSGALYLVAAVSGATDMDAITLSMSRLAGDGKLDASTAWRTIVVATMANMAFKTGIVFVLGNLRLGRMVTVAYATQVALAIVLLLVMA
ncbi:MAG: MgtC/SapB family protein [Phycisphaerales bacterium]|nr:MgtC/SapB family protein [Phycisphaerales bacterium]